MKKYSFWELYVRYEDGFFDAINGVRSSYYENWNDGLIKEAYDAGREYWERSVRLKENKERAVSSRTHAFICWANSKFNATPSGR